MDFIWCFIWCLIRKLTALDCDILHWERTLQELAHCRDEVNRGWQDRALVLGLVDDKRKWSLVLERLRTIYRSSVNRMEALDRVLPQLHISAFKGGRL